MDWWMDVLSTTQNQFSDRIDHICVVHVPWSTPPTYYPCSKHFASLEEQGKATLCKDIKCMYITFYVLCGTD